jgi:L-lysine 6-transaminase
MHDAATGKEILDFYSYFASLPIGHNHPRLTEDEDFQRELRLAAMANPANSDIYSTTYAGFVQTFAQIAKPEAFKYLFFVAGGALAVENALKTAFDWKVRRNRAAGRGDLGTKILHFREAFHGRSGYTMSLTNTDPVKTEAYPKFDWPRVINPKLEFPVTPTGLARVIEVENQSVREIEAAFRKHPHDIAAIIIEPIQGEGGDNHFRGAFLRKLRELADQNEALLIFDEVQTGLGITGKLWAFEHFDVTPDIVAFGKKTQVCGIMVTDRIDNVPDNVFHTPSRINSTWGGNLVDMVRGAKYLEIIRDEDLVANAAARGEELLDGLQRLCTSYPAITNVRGHAAHVEGPGCRAPGLLGSRARVPVLGPDVDSVPSVPHRVVLRDLEGPAHPRQGPRNAPAEGRPHGRSRRAPARSRILTPQPGLFPPSSRRLGTVAPHESDPCPAPRAARRHGRVRRRPLFRHVHPDGLLRARARIHRVVGT